MTPAEAAKLLTIASAYDNRKPDADQARAWALILDDIRYEDAQVVVIEHFRRSRDWLMPVDIIAGVKRIRAKRIAEHPPVIPPEKAHFPTWIADINRRIGDGETFDPDEFRGELKARDMKAPTPSTVNSPAAAARRAYAEGRNQARAAPSKPTDPEHARRKAQARAELDAIRTNPSTDADQGAGEQQEASA
jgi:hypothetical protein